MEIGILREAAVRSPPPRKFGILVLPADRCKPLVSCNAALGRNHRSLAAFPMLGDSHSFVSTPNSRPPAAHRRWRTTVLRPVMELPAGLAPPRSANSRHRAAADAQQSAAAPVLGCWRLTALVRRGESLLLYRARPRDDETGPGCYLLKTARVDRQDELAHALLKREAAVAALVSHPHLSAVLSAATDGSPPYIVLPYLDGVSLRRLMSRSLPLPLGEGRGEGLITCGPAKHPHPNPLPRGAWTGRGLWIARQLAEALAALHAAGWLHGQVRPEHAIVSPQGHVTLMDLSQTRRVGTAECAAPPLAPAYAPPEAFFERGELTTASDVYSLGILLFELLTGRTPFAAGDWRQMAWSHCRLTAPDIREHVPTAPRDVAELVRWMLAKEPLRRPAASELVDRLAGLEITELL